MGTQILRFTQTAFRQAFIFTACRRFLPAILFLSVYTQSTWEAGNDQSVVLVRVPNVTTLEMVSRPRSV